MKWIFWVVLGASFVLVNEYLSLWFLARFVGELDADASYDATFRYASLEAYAFSAAFRAIPYIALAWLAAKSTLRSSTTGRIALWLILIALAAFHFYGYWGMQQSLFTDAHTSSTAGLAAIFIPIWAFIFGCVGYAVFFILATAFRYFRMRWLL